MNFVIISRSWVTVHADHWSDANSRVVWFILCLFFCVSAFYSVPERLIAQRSEANKQKQRPHQQLHLLVVLEIWTPSADGDDTNTNKDHSGYLRQKWCFRGELTLTFDLTVRQYSRKPDQSTKDHFHSELKWNQQLGVWTSIRTLWKSVFGISGLKQAKPHMWSCSVLSWSQFGDRFQNNIINRNPLLGCVFTGTGWERPALSNSEVSGSAEY